MSYKISVKAASDLQHIWEYTVQTWSISQADKYVNAIIDEIEIIAHHPNKGKDISFLKANYRYCKAMSHLIFYRHTENESEIEIIRILHSRMDWPNSI